MLPEWSKPLPASLTALCCVPFTSHFKLQEQHRGTVAPNPLASLLKQQSVTKRSQAGLLASLRDWPAEKLQMQTKPFGYGWSGRLWRGHIGSVEVVYKVAR